MGSIASKLASRIKIRVLIPAAAVCLLIGSLYLFSVFSNAAAKRYAYFDASVDAHNIAVFLQNVSEDAIEAHDIDKLRRQFNSYLGQRKIESYAVVDAKGERILSDGSAEFSAFDIDAIREAQAERHVVVQQDVATGFVSTFAPICSKDDAASAADRKCGYLFLSLDAGKLTNEALQIHRRSVLGFGFLSLVLVSALTVALHRMISAPANRIVESLRALQQGDRAIRMPPAGGRELREIAGAINDLVSQRWREEDQRRTGERWLQAIVEGTSDAVFIKDLAGRYVLLNTATAKYVGKPREGVLGLDDTALFPPDEARFLMEMQRKLLKEGVVKTVEEYLTTAPGKMSTFLATKGPVRDESGNVVGMFGISRDITDRQELGDNLRRARDQLVAITDRIPAIIAHIDGNATIQFINAHGAKILNTPKEELIGRPISKALGKVYRQQENLFSRAFRGDRVKAIQEFVNFQGARHWADWQAIPYVTEGATNGFIWIVSRSAEIHLRAIIDGSPVPQFGFTVDGDIVAVSPAFTRTFGYTIDEVPTVEAWVRKAYPHRSFELDLAPEIARYLAATRERDEQFAPAERRITAKDGRICDVIGTSSRLFTAANDLLYVVTYQDITPLKTIEAQLRLAIDASPVPTFLADDTGRIFGVNSPFTHAFGYLLTDIPTIETWASKAYPSRSYTDDIRLKELGVSSLARLRGEPLDSIETTITCKNGETRHVMTVVSAIESAKDRHIYVVTKQDVTAQKESLKKLEQSEARARAILEASAIPQLLYDRNQRITTVNQKFIDTFGYSPAEIPTTIDLMHRAYPEPVMREKAYAAHAALREDAKRRDEFFYITESKITCKDGTVRTVMELVNAHPHLVNGEAIVNYVDITEAKRLEERVRISEKLEAVGKLTAGVAHDFNNSMAVIVGNLELALQWQNDPKIEKSLKNALAAVQGSSQLTKRLLAYSRQQELQHELSDIGSLIADFMPLLFQALRQDIAVRADVAKDRFFAVVDRGQLRDALLNLSINSRDAMPSGGELFISIQEVAASDLQDVAPNDAAKVPSYLRIRVRDTGLGMTQDVLARATDPFFTTKEFGKGSGLGLSMVYGFTKQSRGWLQILSELGKGTTVEIYLPADRPPAITSAEKDEPTAHAPHGPQQGKALIVEDNLPLLDLLMENFRRWGFEPIPATSGAEAVALAESHKDIRLLFCDIVLPGGMNGYAIASAVTKNLPDCRVLLTSGYADAGIKEADIAGLNILRKPYKTSELYAQIVKLGKTESLHTMAE